MKERKESKVTRESLWSSWVNGDDKPDLGKGVDLRVKIIEFWTLF